MTDPQIEDGWSQVICIINY